MESTSFEQFHFKKEQGLQEFLARINLPKFFNIVYKNGFYQYFHLDLPFQFFQIVKKRTLNIINQVFQNNILGQPFHFGSTAVKGMPGFAFPDFAVEIKNFPPSKQTILKMLSNGYYCIGYFMGDENDIGFIKPFVKQEGIEYGELIHVMKQSHPKFKEFAKSVQKLHQPQYFEAYKKIKIEKMEMAKDGSFKKFMDYKVTKNNYIASLVSS